MTKIRENRKKKKERNSRHTLTWDDTEIVNSFTRELFPPASHLEEQCRRSKEETTRRLRTNASCRTVERTLTRWVSPPFDTSNRSKVVSFLRNTSRASRYRIYEILETKFSVIGELLVKISRYESRSCRKLGNDWSHESLDNLDFYIF